MNILVLHYIMNANCVRLMYYKRHIYVYVCVYIYKIIKWKMVDSYVTNIKGDT